MELEIRGLGKRYGKKTAVSGVELTITPGVWGLIGANGAGKTTLMRMLAGILALAVLVLGGVWLARGGGQSVMGALAAARQPLVAVAESVSGWLEGLYVRLYDYDRLQAENDALRSQIADANEIARAGMDDETTSVALMAPKQEVLVEAGTRNVMSVNIPVFDFKTRTASETDIFSYGFAFTSADLDYAVQSLADVLPDMLKLAETEKACQLMSAEIEKTRRRVNALEHVMIPDLQASIRYIVMKLDENERSTQVRLMKVKDMMLQAQYKN